MLQILLAEDNPGDVFLVRQALEEHHISHELHVAPDGEAAIQFFARMGQPGQAPCPDVLLLDLNLPKIKGPEVLAGLRQHPKCADTPVIVVTSSNALKDRARMAGLGVAAYFCKPVDFEAFMQLGALVRKTAKNV